MEKSNSKYIAILYTPKMTLKTIEDFVAKNEQYESDENNREYKFQKNVQKKT